MLNHIGEHSRRIAAGFFKALMQNEPEPELVPDLYKCLNGTQANCDLAGLPLAQWLPEDKSYELLHFLLFTNRTAIANLQGLRYINKKAVVFRILADALDHPNPYVQRQALDEIWRTDPRFRNSRLVEMNLVPKILERLNGTDIVQKRGAARCLANLLDPIRDWSLINTISPTFEPATSGTSVQQGAAPLPETPAETAAFKKIRELTEESFPKQKESK
jgi:hypothetical protein